MLWFCGGHGVCLTGAGPKGHIEAAVVAWLKRYVANDATVDTGPEFEWLADDAQWRSAARYPLPAGTPITASGKGTLATHSRGRLGHGRHRRPGAERRQRRRCRCKAAAQIVGEPQLTPHLLRAPARPRTSSRSSWTSSAPSWSATRPRRSRSCSTGSRTRSAARWRRSPPPHRRARSTRSS